jgi:hypothetical protein
MDRLRTVTHKGKQIVLLDLTGANATEMLDAAAQAREFYSGLAGDKLLAMTDLTSSHYDSRSLDALKKVAADNRGRVVASAVVSESAAHRAAVSLVSLFSGRRFQSFATRAEALDWLVTQA